MFYLIYVSSATQLLEVEALSELLERARVKNQKLGLTGMLLYKGGNFMQMLEGERETVLQLYDTILQDPRHRNVMKINSGEIESRNFPNWTMGFTNMDSQDGLPKFGAYLQESLIDRKFHDDARFAYEYMLTFNELNE